MCLATSMPLKLGLGFKNKAKKPALILKTSGGVSSYMDKAELLKKIAAIKDTVVANSLPNIYLIHGEFTDEEMNELYNHSKVKAMVSLTKGEGFGRPLLEFTLSKKPMITTAWSGQMDFLNPEFNNLIGGQLTPVHPSTKNHFLIPESKWLSPDLGQIGFYLKDVFENYKNYTDTTNFFSQGKFEVKTTFASTPLTRIPGTGLSGSVGGFAPPPVTSYMFVMGNNGYSSPSAACSNTYSFQTIVYGQYGNPDLNTQLFTDSALTTPFNGGYQYWKWGFPYYYSKVTSFIDYGGNVYSTTTCP